jgi:hypothetical protein
MKPYFVIAIDVAVFAITKTEIAPHPADYLTLAH